MAELCICSTYDWTGEDQTAEHHRECPSTERLMKIADRLKAEAEKGFPVEFKGEIDAVKIGEVWTDAETIKRSYDAAVKDPPPLVWPEIKESRNVAVNVVEFSCNTHGVYHHEKTEQYQYWFFPCPKCGTAESVKIT